MWFNRLSRPTKNKKKFLRYLNLQLWQWIKINFGFLIKRQLPFAELFQLEIPFAEPCRELKLFIDFDSAIAAHRHCANTCRGTWAWTVNWNNWRPWIQHCVQKCHGALDANYVQKIIEKLRKLKLGTLCTKQIELLLASLKCTICFNTSNLRLYTWHSICKNKKYTCYHDDSFYLLAWCCWSRDPEPPLAFMTFSFIVAPDPVGQDPLDPIPSPQDKRREATISWGAAPPTYHLLQWSVRRLHVNR